MLYILLRCLSSLRMTFMLSVYQERPMMEEGSLRPVFLLIYIDFKQAERDCCVVLWNYSLINLKHVFYICVLCAKCVELRHRDVILSCPCGLGRGSQNTVQTGSGLGERGSLVGLVHFRAKLGPSGTHQTRLMFLTKTGSHDPANSWTVIKHIEMFQTIERNASILALPMSSPVY